MKGAINDPLTFQVLQHSIDETLFSLVLPVVKPYRRIFCT